MLFLFSRHINLIFFKLLLIRACSSFLNPINRFWPHPKVLRNLMHEFVPESRTKTTYSLMAAGVRELKDRMPQQQYLVKTMASYPELLNLRNQIGEMNFMQKSGAEEDDLRQKDYFFVDAFRKAYQLLFKETDNFPSINASDFDFGSYIHMNNLHFVQVSNTKNGSIPLRCQKPEDKKAIRASVTYNAIMVFFWLIFVILIKKYYSQLCMSRTINWLQILMHRLNWMLQQILI